MPLIDSAIRKAKPLEKAVRLFDGQGLYLEVSLAGGKLWRLKYRFAGKEKRLGLGIYPAVTSRTTRRRTSGFDSSWRHCYSHRRSSPRWWTTCRHRTRRARALGSRMPRDPLAYTSDGESVAINLELLSGGCGWLHPKNSAAVRCRRCGSPGCELLPASRRD